MSGPRNAADRLRRLLVVLPYLMEAGELPLAEVARRFDMSERDVAADLELVAMCGLPPYVDEMVDVFVDDGMVYVGVPRLFTRPLRLTAPEAFSLLAAGRTAMQLPGFDHDGPLARGLEKVSSVLGAAGIEAPGDDTAGVAIDLERPEVTDLVIEAVADDAELEVAYYTPARDEVGERSIVPRHVFVDGGNWYVRADDAASGERRTFRLDRIERAVRTGRVTPAEPDAGDPAQAEPFFADADLPRARLRIDASARWIVDRYPTDEVIDLGGGGAEVVLPVASERWLARLMLRLGATAELIEPGEFGDPVAALARRVLAGYDD